MNSIYSIYEGLLRGMDDTLDVGEKEAEKVLIIDWLNKNNDYVKMFVDHVPDYNADSKLRLNDKNEMNLYDFKPVQPYLKKQMMDLPAPDYIKFNNVGSMSIIYPDKKVAFDLNFAKLPHINYCNELFIKCFDDTPVWVKLDDLKIDNIKILDIDIPSIRPSSWPKCSMQLVHMLSGGYIYSGSEYSETTIKRYNHDFDIELFKGLKTDTLVIPDVLFTRRSDLIGYRVDVEITKDDPEYDTLMKLFDMKVFNKLYASPACGRTDIFRQIKFKNGVFIISKLNTNIYKKFSSK